MMMSKLNAVRQKLSTTISDTDIGGVMMKGKNLVFDKTCHYFVKTTEKKIQIQKWNLELNTKH